MPALHLRTHDDLANLAELYAGIDLPLNLVVADVSILRLLSLPRHNEVLIRGGLQLRVENWSPPSVHWRGSVRIPSSCSVFQVEPDGRRRRIDFYIRLREPAPLSDVIRLLYPAVMPSVRAVGAGMPHVAVDASAPSEVLGMLATSVARGDRPFPDSLRGVGLRPADVLLVGENYGHGGSERATATIPVASVAEKHTFALDLRTHNPIGRVPNFHRPARSWTTEIHSDGLIRLRGSGASIDDREVAIQGWTSLSSRDVAKLSDIVSLDLTSIDRRALTSTRGQLAARLVELAASGVFLHGLRDGVLGPESGVDPDLLLEFQRGPGVDFGMSRDLRSVRQRRLAMRRHSGVFKLSQKIADSTGWRTLPTVSVVLCSKRPGRVRAVLDMMAKQTYPHMEVVLVLHGVAKNSLGRSEADGVKIIEVGAEALFGEALAQGLRASEGDLVTKADDDDWYSPEHLWDLVLAHLYSGADVVGKTTEHLYLESVGQTIHRRFATERYHEQVAGGAMLMSRETLETIGGWRPTVNSTDRSILVRVSEEGGTAYRTHSLGYMYFRHSEAHTWERSDSHLLAGSFEQWKGLVLPAEAADLQGGAGELAARLMGPA